MSKSNGNTIIRMNQLMELTGLARATIYKLLKNDPAFPKQVRLTPSKGRGAAVGWDLGEVIAWLEQRMNERNSPEIQPATEPCANRTFGLRDLFAGLAMQSYLAHSDNQESAAKKAYAMADTMLTMRRLKI